MEERFKDMAPYDRAVRISLYSNRVGKMEEQKDHTEDPEAVKALENTYTGAKMMGDEEVMLRASRALLAFKADVHKDIFIEENVLEF